MSDITCPYYDTELFSKLILYPIQINNDIYINLKNNLKEKVEKKCNKYGYITKVYKILDMSEGEIIPENFDASVIFNVKFSCRICLPTINKKIICKVDLYNKSLIKAINGPIICIISNNNINTDNFSIDNKGDYIHTSNTPIKTGSHIIVKINGLNFYGGDERILLLGQLDDLPTNEEIIEFYNEDLDDNEKIQENNLELNESEEEVSSDLDSEEAQNENYENL